MYGQLEINKTLKHGSARFLYETGDDREIQIRYPEVFDYPILPFSTQR